MKRLLAGVSIAIVALAGCLGGDQGPALDIENPAPASHVAVLLETVSGGLRLSAQGEPGSFLVLHAPWTTPVSELELDVDVTARTTSEGEHSVFYWPPDLTYEKDEGYSWGHGYPFVEKYLDFPDGPWEQTDAFGWSASFSGGAFAGISVAMASDVAWELDIELAVDPPLDAARIQFITGNGTTFGSGASRSIQLIDGGGPVNEVSYAADIQGPGWTHVETQRGLIQPTGLRSYDFELANGHQVSGIAIKRGYYVPFVMGSAASANWVDFVGSLRDQEGSLRAEVLYAEATAALDIGHVHIPLASDALPGLDYEGANYHGSTWPFPAEWPPGVTYQRR